MGYFKEIGYKRLSLVLFLCVALVLLVSCETYDSAVDDISKVFSKDDSVEYYNVSDFSCPESKVFEADKISYFFENHVEGLNVFLDSSDEFVYCSFPVLNDFSIASNLVQLNNKGIDVKVAFDRTSSFENCETACIPRSGTQINYMIGENMDLYRIESSDRLCVNEEGVFFYGGNFDEDGVTYSYSIYYKQFAGLYKEYFEGLI